MFTFFSLSKQCKDEDSINEEANTTLSKNGARNDTHITTDDLTLVTHEDEVQSTSSNTPSTGNIF